MITFRHYFSTATFIRLVIIALSYYLGGQLGLSLATYANQVTMIWPPTGIAMFALLAWGIRMWPAIWLAALMINLPLDTSVPASMVIATGNTLGPVLATVILSRLNFNPTLSTLRDVLFYIGFAVIAGMALNAALGTTALVLDGILEFSLMYKVWLTWWLGDALGALIVGPALLTLQINQKTQIDASRLETLLVWSALLLVAIFCITPLSPFPKGLPPMLPFPLIIWLALRQNNRHATWAALILSAMALWGVLAQTNSFIDHLGEVNLQQLWTYIFALGLTTLLITSLRSESTKVLIKSNENTLRLQEAQRIAKIGSWAHDLNSNHFECSDETFRIFEMDKNSFSTSYEAFLNLIHPEDKEKVNRTYTESLEKHENYEITYRLLLSGERIKYIHERCETHYEEEKPVLSQGTVQDVTEQKEAEEKINLYASVFMYSPDAIMITDHNNCIVAVNPSLTKLTGYTNEELIGNNPKILASGHTKKEIYAAMWRALSEKGYWHGELFDRRKDGKVYPKWISISVLRNAEDKISNYIATFTDISERKAADEKIKHLAHHDTLTGLYNRFSLEERLGQAISQASREEKLLSVLFIDMDHFKKINDTLGHHVGDLLLMQVANRLQSLVRDSDIVARLGGDEFVVVFTLIDNFNKITGLAAKIIDSLSGVYTIDKHELNSTPSVGVSVFPEDGRDVEILMQKADTAMYHAKAQGRNNYQFFAETMNISTQERLTLENDIRTALDENQFELYYQAKVETASGQVSGVEALIRWKHPKQGMISPDKFIPIAEEIGLINRLGDWVLKEASLQLSVWKEKGIFVKMAINLSPKQLQDPSLIERLKKIMVLHKVTESELELEITETAAMANADHAIEQMKAIRTVGVDLAIDDFGTGYSSLAYLKLFPIQTLKIDRAFVRDIGHDGNDEAICIATISLAHSLGLMVVAEGVETEAQQTFLSSHGCDFLQGYLFCRPLPSDLITEFLARSLTA